MVDLPFGFDKPEDSPGFLLWQTSVVWQRLVKKTLEPYDISHAQFVIMALLLWFEEQEYDITQILIVNWSKLDKMTVSQALKKLVAQGLVQRVEHEVDTRAKRPSLTEKGKTLLCQLVPLVEKIDADFFGKITAQDQRELIRILNILNTHEFSVF